MAEPISTASHNYQVVVLETPVPRAECGPNSHDAGSLEGLIELLKRRNDEGWELLVGHRDVRPDPDTGGRIARHELAFQRATTKRKFDYRIDALSDPENPMPEQYMQDRIAQGWTLVACTRQRFEDRVEDALLIWKKGLRRFGS